MAYTKTEFKWFTILQYKAEQEYLREMHLNGWKLTKVSFPGFYHFEACNPEDMVYQLDYNQNGTVYKREYIQLFADCGWEYMFDFVGYSYFRKPASQMEGMQGSEEIFCDDESRLEMMKRVFKGRVIPLLCVFFGIVLPQFFLQTSMAGRSAFNQGMAIFYWILFAVYLVILITFGIQFFSYEKKIREPEISGKLKYGGLLFISLVMCALLAFGTVRLLKPADSKYELKKFSDEYSIGAEYLNDTIRHEMKFKAGDKLEVTLQILEGDVHLRIYRDEKNPIYDVTVSEWTQFTLPIPENGMHTILVTGEQAEGSFRFQKK